MKSDKEPMPFECRTPTEMAEAVLDNLKHEGRPSYFSLENDFHRQAHTILLFRLATMGGCELELAALDPSTQSDGVLAEIPFQGGILTRTIQRYEVADSLRQVYANLIVREEVVLPPDGQPHGIMYTFKRTEADG